MYKFIYKLQETLVFIGDIVNIEIKVYMLVRLHNHTVVGIVNEVKIVGLWCVSFKLVAFIGVKISTNCMLLLLKYISTAFALQTTFLSEVPHYCFRIKFKTFSFPCVFPVILYVLTQNGISLFILRTNMLFRKNTTKSPR